MEQDLPFQSVVNDEDWNLTVEKVQSIIGSPAQDCTATTVISPLLEEAIKHYRHGIPPFLVSRASQPGAHDASVPDKTVILFENDDPEHKKTRERTIVYRTWNDKYGFWTLDLNGKRSIVKSIFMHYYPWLSCLHGFSSDPVAHCLSGARARGSIKSKKLVRDDFDGKNLSPSQVTQGADRPLIASGRAERTAKTRAKQMIKVTAKWFRDPEITPAHLPYVSNVASRYPELEAPVVESPQSTIKRKFVPISPKLKDHRPQSMPNGQHTDRKSLIWMNSTSEGFAKVSESERRRREVFSTPESTKVVLGSKRMSDDFSPTYPKDIASASKRRCQALLHRELSPSGCIREIGSASESIQAIASSLGEGVALFKGNFGEITPPISPVERMDRNAFRRLVDENNQQPSIVEKTSSKNLGTLDRKTNKVSAPPNPAPKVVLAGGVVPNSQTHHILDVKEDFQNMVTPTKQDTLAKMPDSVGASSDMLTKLAAPGEGRPLALLTPHKVSNTFFLVTIPPNSDFKMVKLSSCATFIDISTMILKSFRMEDRIDQVDLFRFKFEWLPADSIYRTMLIEPDQMSSCFDYVLKRIDKADLWATEGECYLGVEVFFKQCAK